MKLRDSLAENNSIRLQAEANTVGRQSILDSDRVVWKFPQALTGAG